MGLGSSKRRAVEELDPVVEWKQAGADRDVVEILLPGFKKEQVRVQVDDYGVLRAAGERPAPGGRRVWFRKDFLLPEACDVDGVRADFIEKLVITLPIVPEEPSPLVWPPTPPAPATPPPVSPEVPASPGVLPSPPASPQGPIYYSAPSPSPARRSPSLPLSPTHSEPSPSPPRHPSPPPPPERPPIYPEPPLSTSLESPPVHSHPASPRPLIHPEPSPSPRRYPSPPFSPTSSEPSPHRSPSPPPPPPPRRPLAPPPPRRPTYVEPPRRRPSPPPPPPRHPLPPPPPRRPATPPLSRPASYSVPPPPPRRRPPPPPPQRPSKPPPPERPPTYSEPSPRSRPLRPLPSPDRYSEDHDYRPPTRRLPSPPAPPRHPPPLPPPSPSPRRRPQSPGPPPAYHDLPIMAVPRPSSPPTAPVTPAVTEISTEATSAEPNTSLFPEPRLPALLERNVSISPHSPLPPAPPRQNHDEAPKNHHQLQDSRKPEEDGKVSKPPTPDEDKEKKWREDTGVVEVRRRRKLGRAIEGGRPNQQTEELPVGSEADPTTTTMAPEPATTKLLVNVTAAVTRLVGIFMALWRTQLS